ncbi:hypothetical protein F511_33416 [Dorcoceras hygrometricum]|uniref:Uncharacterized protein n=1 Tax=Dorcoceras hygrometricum TaxID=472368 RepID=A0A2Z7C019_9LAMI|nr:hypothetical protein F511_33416 [Dorcoceras hygrometricum]
MGLTAHPTTKGNKSTKTSGRSRSGSGGGRILCGFGACFGLSSPEKQHRKNLAYGPVPPAKSDRGVYGSKEPIFAEPDIPTSESIKEIHTADSAAHQFNGNTKTNVDEDIITGENKKDKREEINIPSEISSNRPTIKLRHSVSPPAWPLPPQPRLKKVKTAAATIVEGANGDEMSAVVAGEVDSQVGAAMITLTLVVMLIWGKVCAILCSFAWVLFVHFVRQNNESLEHNNALDHHPIIPDLDSHEHKKRVVLQGFLQRI